MNAVNTNYDLTLEIKSPVFIGTSQEKNWVRNIDFIHYKGKVFILNQHRLFTDMDDQQREKYTSLIAKNRYRDLERFLTNDFDLEDYADHIFDYDGKLNGNEIKPLIRGGNGQTYIPGSSIKGAISSSLFGYLYHATHQRGVSDDLSKQLLGSFDKALGRFIRPFDTTENTLESEISDVNLFNLRQQYGNWEADFKENFRILLESFKPKTKTKFRLSLADGLGTFLQKRGRNLLPKNYHRIFTDQPLETLFRIINDQTKKHLAKEIAFFETYDQDEDVPTIIDQLAFLQDLVETPNACLLRMSGGSGFHGITGDWRFSDHLQTIDQPDKKNMIYDFKTRQRKPARYKSRRVAYPWTELMGFVQLSRA
ncbi:MAG: RAMP superfamily CRISPR-associated protein [Bacteroidota bacterium]